MSKITQRELATKLNLSPQYISKLVKQGILPLHDGLLDENECITILNERDTNQAHTSTQQDNKVNQYYRKAKAAKMTNEAKIAGVELQQKQLKLEDELIKYIDSEKAISDAIELNTTLRNFIDLIPEKVANCCSHKTASQISSIIDDAISDALTDIQNWVADCKKQSANENQVGTP